MNIVSMTGFGCAVAEDENLSVSVEIKTVNSRFADFNIKMPREYTPFEIELRNEVSKVLKRGRFDIFVTKQLKASASEELELDWSLFNSYLHLFDEVQQKLNYRDESARASFINDLLIKKEIVASSERQTIFDNEKQLLFTALSTAVSNVYKMRQEEGKSLATNLVTLINELDNIRQDILEKSKDAPQNYHKKLSERIAKLEPEFQIDQQRLATEVALFADRVDITEELTRLQSHLQHIRASAETTPNGRTFDFLTQECGREFNTITSKAQDAEIQTLAVAGKSTLEKFREQIQNIE